MSNGFIALSPLKGFKLAEDNITVAEECSHSLEFIGEQKAEQGSNKYFRCVKCGDVFVQTADETKVYRIPAVKKS
ncbi:MAG: hypothetical protein QW614_03625 [Candidatus Caldarchaeum sp.]